VIAKKLPVLSDFSLSRAYDLEKHMKKYKCTRMKKACVLMVSLTTQTFWNTKGYKVPATLIKKDATELIIKMNVILLRSNLFSTPLTGKMIWSFGLSSNVPCSEHLYFR